MEFQWETIQTLSLLTALTTPRDTPATVVFLAVASALWVQKNIVASFLFYPYETKCKAPPARAVYQLKRYTLSSRIFRDTH